MMHDKDMEELGTFIMKTDEEFRNDLTKARALSGIRAQTDIVRHAVKMLIRSLESK